MLHQVVEERPQSGGEAPATSSGVVSSDSVAYVAAVVADSVPQHGAKRSQN